MDPVGALSVPHRMKATEVLLFVSVYVYVVLIDAQVSLHIYSYEVLYMVKLNLVQ